jgi:paraquat-inducible protein B
LQAIADIVGSTEMKEAIASASASSAKLETLMTRLDGAVPALVTNLTETTVALNKALSEVATMFDAQSPARYEFTEAMEQVGAAAEATRDLMDYLQRHPESLLAGKQQKRLE